MFGWESMASDSRLRRSEPHSTCGSGVAEHFRQLRLTAKFDVLESRWPGLLRKLQTDLAEVELIGETLARWTGGRALARG